LHFITEIVPAEVLGGDSLVVHAAQGGVLLHGVLAGVRCVGVGGQGARLHMFLLCGFVLLRVLGGVVIGGVVADHLLHVLGGVTAGGGRVVVRTAARACGVLNLKGEAAVLLVGEWADLVEWGDLYSREGFIVRTY
jgi:hypothetical protein